MVGAYGFKHAENTSGVYVGSEFGRVERYLYMALCCKIVYFRWLYFAYNLYERH